MSEREEVVDRRLIIDESSGSQFDQVEDNAEIWTLLALCTFSNGQVVKKRKSSAPLK